MAKNPRAKETLKKADRALVVWDTIPDFKIGSISLNDFKNAVNTADSLAKQHVNHTIEGAGLKANRDDKVGELNDLVVRFLSGIHSTYGPDSPLYEQAGGTRPRARKSSKHPAETAPAANATAAAAAAAGPATTTANAQHA